MRSRIQLFALALFLSVFGLTNLTKAQTGSMVLEPIGTYQSGVFDEGAAEIGDYDAASKLFFFSNANDNTIGVLDFTNPASPSLVLEIAMSAYGGGVNSVKTNGTIVAVAVEANTKQDPGSVVAFNIADIQTAIASAADPKPQPTAVFNVTVGALPDMIIFTPDGTKILVANEGEPNDSYEIDPEGSISIITVADQTVQTATFNSFDHDKSTLISNGVRLNGVRLNGTPATVSEDLEPEYIAVNNDGTTAWAVCQENNALAVVDIASATVSAILPLGYKDHMMTGMGLDPSDRDDGVNIANWPVKGMYMPDAIKFAEIGGNGYILSANEGDGREYEFESPSTGEDTLAFLDESRLEDLILNPARFPNWVDLLEREQLGRLTVSVTDGLSDSVAAAELDGAQEVPSVTTTAEGAALLWLDGTQLKWQIVVEGLDFGGFIDGVTPGTGADSVSMMHIHAGARGANGGVVVDILGNSTVEVSDDNEVLITGMVDTTGIGAFTSAWVAADHNTELAYYFNVHTKGNPAGEIRGQVIKAQAYDEVYSYGARSFSIWNASTGALVWDSGDQLEKLTAQFFPTNFNSNNDENDSFESRSDNKGPEPEAINVAEIGGKTYAFVGLERIGGVFVYDISTPTAPEFVTYRNNRDFSVADVENAPGIFEVGDLGVEDIVFIPAGDSPNGKNLIVTTNEVTGSVTVFEAQMQANPNEFTLTILHNNDGESQLVNLGGDLADYGGIARFKAAVDTLRSKASTDAVVTLSSGDNYLPGPEFNASFANDVYYDALGIQAVGYDALAIGNHDFDFGPSILADFISSMTDDKPVYLSSNLDFSNEGELNDLFNAGRIAKSTIITRGGTQIGVIGATTPELRQISSPGQVGVDSDLTAAIQAEVSRLEGLGVNKIILISHLQSIQEDSALATTLTGVDVMIAGGGDEVLANAGATLVPGDEDEIYGTYPMFATSADAKQIPIVTTKGSYSYVGRLQVTFDANGDVTVATGAAEVVDVNVYGEDGDLKTNVVDPVVAYNAGLASNIIASSEVVLDGRRSAVRSRETNQGNLVADALLWEARRRASEFGIGEADVALQNGGGIRNDSEIPAGDISELFTFDALPFSNFVTVLEDIPVTQFVEILENAVSRVESGSGRFAQVAGFSFFYDTFGTPQELDEDGNVVTEGERIISVVLDNGDVLVQNGEIVDENVTLNIATIDFLARGGDGYPYRGADFTRVGSSYQQALFNYITSAEGLNGTISASDYPAEGSGRILSAEEPMAIADAKARPVGESVYIKGIVTRTLKRQLWIQDESAGIVFFGGLEDQIASGEVREGDMIHVYAKRAVFNDLDQLSGDVGGYMVEARNQRIPAPVFVESLADLGEDLESSLVTLSGLTFTSVTEGDTLVPSRSYDISDGTNTGTLRTASGSDDPFYEFEGFDIPTGEFTFVGVLGQFRDDYQLTPIRPTDIRSASDEFTLTLLHNNDGESQLINAGSGDLADFGGIARFKTLVDSLRFEAQKKGGALLLSSGDNFLAGPEFNLNFELADDEPFLDAIALDMIGYDAFALGNHDFDFGPDVLARFINSFENDVTFLSANLDFSAEDTLQQLVDADKIAAAVILPAGGELIGVIGATTPNLDFISSPRDVIIQDDVAAVVQSYIDALEGEGVDKIVLISHLQGVGEDSLLATQLSGLDVMIAGGGDEVLANPGALLVPGDEAVGAYPMIVEDSDGNELPIVTTAGNYKYVGKLEVTFDANGDVTSVMGDPVRVAGGSNPDAVQPDQRIIEEVITRVEAGLAALDANVIANSEVVLDGRRGSVRGFETNQGNLIADAMLWQGQQLASSFGVTSPLVGIQNGGGIRNDSELPAGDITELQTFDMLPFSNFVTIVEGVTPQILRNVIENAVSAIGGTSGTGRFAQVAGLSFEYNPDLTPMNIEDGEIVEPGQRVISITLDDGTAIVENGAIVDGAPTIAVAIADFSAKGGDEYPFGDLDLTLLGVTYQRALYNYIVDGLDGQITAADYPVGGEGRIVETDAVSTEVGDGLPKVFALNQNYPNPFNPSTSMAFDLPVATNVRLEVFDMLGRRVAMLVNEERAAGSYTVNFDASGLSSGMYLYRIQAGTFNMTKKMMLVK